MKNSTCGRSHVTRHKSHVTHDFTSHVVPNFDAIEPIVSFGSILYGLPSDKRMPAHEGVIGRYDDGSHEGTVDGSCHA
jgi:hypothetical protein